ncbi:cell surface protein, partial [Streptococcus pneumoniae]|nr:cell surface protein [Streptococcus pneumoniae]
MQIVRDLHSWDENKLSSFKKTSFEMTFLENQIEVSHIPNG